MRSLFLGSFAVALTRIDASTVESSTNHFLLKFLQYLRLLMYHKKSLSCQGSHKST